MKRLAEVAISLALGAAVLYAVFMHFDVQYAMNSVRHAHPSLLVLGVMLMVASYLLWGPVADLGAQPQLLELVASDSHRFSGQQHLARPPGRDPARALRRGKNEPRPRANDRVGIHRGGADP